MARIVLSIFTIGAVFCLSGCLDSATRAQVAQAIETGAQVRNVWHAPHYAPVPNNMVPVAPPPTFGGADQSTQPAPPPQNTMLPMVPPSSFDGAGQPVQVQSGGVTATLVSQSSGTSVTGLSIVRCFYQYNGQQFEKDFASSCPASVQVQ